MLAKTCQPMLMGMALLLFVQGMSSALGAASTQESPPLGSPEFYPTSERPVGWRGDRTGSWPGATPVQQWDAASGENIVWKTPMPGISWSQPVIVGEKVFTKSDPNILLCVSAIDGAILWQTELDHTTMMSSKDAAFVKGEIAFFEQLWEVYGQWRLDLEQFWRDAAAQGVDPKPLKHPKGRRLSGESSSLNGDLKERYESLYKRAEEHGFEEKNSTGNGNTINCNGPHRDRWARLVRDYDVWFFNGWQSDSGDSMATPTSDGEFIYVTGPNCQTACYDLNGKQQWMVWDHPQGKGNEINFLGTRFTPSPLLVGNALIVNNNGEIRVYDKRSGKKIWGVVAPYRDDDMRHCRPKPEAVSPVALTLPLDGGKTLAVVTDGGGNIYRLADGKIVGRNLPSSDKGASPISLGDLYIWKTGSDSHGSSRGVCRLKAVSEDVVEFTELWRFPRSHGAETSDVYYDGWIYDGRAARYELLTGTEEKVPAVVGSWCSPSIGGGLLVGIDRGQGPDKVAAPVRILWTKDFSKNWTNPNGIVDRRKLDDPEFRRRWRYVLNPHDGDLVGNSSPVFSGNRMFFRSGGHLWCIGDPKKKFQVSADCPPEARAKSR